jgi:Protein of unknown function (DUF4232)
VRLRERLTPYILLGVLTLGTGLGIGLGLSEAPITHPASPSLSRVPTTTVSPPPTSAIPPATSASLPAHALLVPCSSGQLSAKVGRVGVALGNVGVIFTFTNTSPRTCSLQGYPGVHMLDANGDPLPTEVTDGVAYTVPSIPEQVVDLKPGASASFDLGYSDSTGYGTAICPEATTLAITPPGAQQPISVTVEVDAYGGSTIQTLHCGDITVSPVYFGPGGQP